MSKRWTLLVLSAALVMGLGLGPSHILAQGEEAEAVARKVEITLGEFFFQVEGGTQNAPITLQAGERVALELMNTGLILHEAFFGQDANIAEGKYNLNLLEDVEVIVEGIATGGKFEVEAEGLGEVELEPNVELELLFTVPNTPGTFEIGCFIPGHYQAGMHAPLIIAAP
ncbi:MAG: hypothetical protein HY335_04395 [Deinococcus sp.]|nr:hypothetical protein [Deinococcus sp.]